MEGDILNKEYDTDEAIEFIRQYLPQDLKTKFSDDEMYYFLDVLDEYFIDSGILGDDTEEDGIVEIDLEAASDFIVKEARKDEMGSFDPDEIFLIIQGELDYIDSISE